MSGTGHSTKYVSRTGNQNIDGLLSGIAWNDSIIYYSFPTSSSEYSYSGEPSTFAAILSAQQAAAHFALNDGVFITPTIADDGFSIEGFTNLVIVYSNDINAHIRLAESDSPSTAWAYYPSTSPKGGDVWFNTGSYRSPQAGNYAWHTHLHEIGHALGLKHGHETDTFGAAPPQYDSMEYSIMTYRSYVGHDLNTYNYYMNEFWGFAQTYMMADIAALQHMYGADFTTNSGDTVYKWEPNSGNTWVNGEIGIDAGGARIFATIWDGGGTDTYDLSAYSSNLSIDLRPGQHSLFSSVQRAYLGNGNYSRGNIFNALLYNNDPRSLIENAAGGSGNDTIRGNQADNVLTGNAGDDTMYGYDGNDTFRYVNGLGADAGERLYGGSGTDRILLTSTFDTAFNFRGFDVSSIEEIEFAADGQNVDKIAIFNAEEFDTSGEFASNLLIDGNDSTGSTDAIQIHMLAVTSLDISGWTFQQWGSQGETITILGDESSETIIGSSQRDIIEGGAGWDKLDGGSGFDTARFSGDRADYFLTSFNGQVAILTNGTDGHDLASEIESFLFADQSVAVDTVSEFKAFEYLASHNDLITSLGGNQQASFDHYFAHGFTEGRALDAFANFEYLATYDDLIRAFGANENAAASHFVNWGYGEGRIRDGFAGFEYLATYDDLIQAYGTNENAAALHFVNWGYGEGRTRDGFDGLQYIASYGDLIEAFGVNEHAAGSHFVEWGYNEGRVRDNFNAQQYLANYVDLQAAYGNNETAATIHFITYGYSEGRTDAQLLA